MLTADYNFWGGSVLSSTIIVFFFLTYCHEYNRTETIISLLFLDTKLERPTSDTNLDSCTGKSCNQCSWLLQDKQI